MIRMQTILYIIYFIIVIASYPYLVKSWFPQNTSKMEKLVMGVLASVWIVSVPVTAMIKADDEGEEI